MALVSFGVLVFQWKLPIDESHIAEIVAAIAAIAGAVWAVPNKTTETTTDESPK